MALMMLRPIPRLWLPLALILSLGGNMLLGGYIWRDMGHRGPPNIDTFVERLVADLPAADADILRRAFAERRHILLQNDRNREAFHEDLARLLQAEPFSPERLATFLQEQDDRLAAGKRAMQEAIIAAATAMSPQGRQQMARFRP